MHTRTVKIPKVAEHDIRIVFPDGKTWLLQYRNYKDCMIVGNNASVDLLLDQTRPVNNLGKDGMCAAPAKSERESHVREADQLCVIL